MNIPYIINLAISVVAVLIALTVHEVSHGYVAYKMGDLTAKEDGRLSLNPLKHLDFFGAICLILFHIGWAKPVPINPYMFKNRKWGIIAVSLAGPFSNFLLAVFAILVYFILCFSVSMETDFIYYLSSFLVNFSVINIGLGVFNLIPIPPLDGSKALSQFLPNRIRFRYLQFERFGGIVIFLLVYFGKLSNYLSMAINFIFHNILTLFSYLFSLMV